MNGLVSIIVPVFNTEVYLIRCIESLLQQSYNDIEIILVNDGSTDKSRDICLNYSETQQNIYYLEQENSGVSSARNRGIDASNGKYIVFVDSDDYVHERYIELLVDGMNDSNLSICGYYKVNETNDVISSNLKGERRRKKFTTEEFCKYLFYLDEFNYQGYLFNKMFLSEIILEKHIHFAQEISYNEDRLFVLEYLMFCKGLKYCDTPYYYYLQHSDSAMAKNSQMSSQKRFSEIVAFQQMIQMMKKNKLDSVCYAIFDGYNALCGKYCDFDKREQVIGKRMMNKWLFCIIFSNKLSRKDKLKAVIRYLYIKLKFIIRAISRC